MQFKTLSSDFSRIAKNHYKDWLVLLILALAIVYLWGQEPFRKQFLLDDPTISHPFAKVETVNVVALLSISFVSPFVLLVFSEMVSSSSNDESHNVILAYFLTHSVNEVVTNIAKVMVGRPRPDFLERCLPIQNLLSDKLKSVQYYTRDICSSTDMRLVIDGQKSFFSGHSSMSFAGATFLTLYFITKWNILSPDTKQRWFKLILSCIPIFVALFICLSRIMDYRHHPEDVLVGILVGTGFGALGHFMAFSYNIPRKNYSHTVTDDMEEPLLCNFQRQESQV